MQPIWFTLSEAHSNSHQQHWYRRGKVFPSLRLRVSFKVGLKRPALALRLFIFSNVVTISAGTLLALPLYSVRTDEEIYPNDHEIDSFQVFRLRDKEGDDVLAARHPLVTTSRTIGLCAWATRVVSHSNLFCPGAYFRNLSRSSSFSFC